MIHKICRKTHWPLWSEKTLILIRLRHSCCMISYCKIMRDKTPLLSPRTPKRIRRHAQKQQSRIFQSFFLLNLNSWFSWFDCAEFCNFADVICFLQQNTDCRLKGESNCVERLDSTLAAVLHFNVRSGVTMASECLCEQVRYNIYITSCGIEEYLGMCTFSTAFVLSCLRLCEN